MKSIRPIRPIAVSAGCPGPLRVGQRRAAGAMTLEQEKQIPRKAPCQSTSKSPARHKITMKLQKAIGKRPRRRLPFTRVTEIKPTHPKGATIQILSRAGGDVRHRRRAQGEAPHVAMRERRSSCLWCAKGAVHNKGAMDSRVDAVKAAGDGRPSRGWAWRTAPAYGAGISPTPVRTCDGA